MAKKVITSLNAEAELLTIALYILQEFVLKASTRFLEKYEMKVKLIANFPERYPLYNEQTNIRKAVLNRYCIIFYKEFEEEISIVSVFDTRQDPDKITGF